MTAAPNHSYLPYNLGLIFQRMNRTREAEQSFKTAREVALHRAEQAATEAAQRSGDSAYQTEAL